MKIEKESFVRQDVGTPRQNQATIYNRLTNSTRLCLLLLFIVILPYMVAFQASATDMPPSVSNKQLETLIVLGRFERLIKILNDSNLNVDHQFKIDQKIYPIAPVISPINSIQLLVISQYITGQYNDAISSANKWFKFFGEKASADNKSATYILRGSCYYNLSQYPKAIDDFTEAIKLTNDPVAYVSRAAIYTKLGDTNKASDDQSHAMIGNTPCQTPTVDEATALRLSQHTCVPIMELYPDIFASNDKSILQKQAIKLFNKAELLEDEGKYTEAIKQYNNALNIYPNDAGGWAALGLCYMTSNNGKKAEAAFKKSLALDSKNWKTWNDLGGFYLHDNSKDRAQNLNSAKSALEVALSFKSNIPQIQQQYIANVIGIVNGLSMLSMQLKYPEAIIYYNGGLAKYKSGDFKGAIDDYDHALKINPNLAEAYYNRGLAKKGLGQQNLAAKDFDKAKKLGYKPESK